jgi:hypothetical protein
MLLTLLQVAFNTCSVLTDDTAEAYGLVWKPAQAADLPSAVQLPVISAAPTRPGCFWYKVGATAGTRHKSATDASACLHTQMFLGCGCDCEWYFCDGNKLSPPALFLLN